MVQSYRRCLLARNNYLHQREAALKIQNAFRVMMCRYAFLCYKHAANEIQRFVRGQISRNRLLGASSFGAVVSRHGIIPTNHRYYSTELKVVIHSIVKLQRWWKRTSEHKLTTEAAVLIQSYVRGLICRRRAEIERRHAFFIQAHWKGCLARKDAKQQLI